MRLASEQDTVNLHKLVRTMQHEVEYHVVPRYRRLAGIQQQYGHREDHGNIDSLLRSWETYLNGTERYRAANPAVAARYFEDSLQDLDNNTQIVPGVDVQIEWQRTEPLFQRTLLLAAAIAGAGGLSHKMMFHLHAIVARIRDALPHLPDPGLDLLAGAVRLPAWN